MHRVLGVLATLGILAGLFSIARPLRFLRIRSRLHALAVVVVSFVVLAAVAPPPAQRGASGGAPASVAGTAGDTKNGGSETVSPAQPERRPSLEVVDWAWTKGQMGGYVYGIVRNNTDRDYSYVQISFNVYDANMNQIDSALDNITNLEAHGTWKFRAHFFRDGAEYAKLASIAGY